jgi:hypothetical protein
MVDFGPARDLVLGLNLDFHGFPVTVTRPAPNDTPIATRGLWLRPLAEAQPYGTDWRNAQPRRILVLPKTTLGTGVAAVPTCPRGTTIAAPVKLGDANVNWVAEGDPQPAENDCWYVTVNRAL